MKLSLMTITQAEPHALIFLSAMADLAKRLGAELVIAADGHDAFNRLSDIAGLRRHVTPVRSSGFLESVHDEVLAKTTGDYVFRLDDDESVSPSLQSWLQVQAYLDEPHWKFARAALWHRADLFIHALPLWPDHQTRLSKRSLAGGRNHIHAGSPYGGGAECPSMILHHKFLVKTREQRQEIVDRYDRVSPGAGSGGMLAFQIPEAAYQGFPLAPVGNGLLRDYSPDEFIPWEISR